MPFDDRRYHAPARNGDVAGIALQLSLALNYISEAMLQIKLGEDITKPVAEIGKIGKKLDEMFDTLTGWTSDGD